MLPSGIVITALGKWSQEWCGGEDRDNGVRNDVVEKTGTGREVTHVGIAENLRADFWTVPGR